MEVQMKSSKSRLLWIKKLWAGDYGLSKTFWVFNFFAAVIFNLISDFIFESISLNFRNDPAAALPLLRPLALVSLFFILIYGAIANIGLWNAATRYRGLRFWTWLTALWNGLYLVLLLNLLLSLSIILRTYLL